MRKTHVVIENSNTDVFSLHGLEAQERIFETIAEAEEYIHQSALDAFSSETCLNDPEHWGSRYFICEVKKIVRPIPRVRVEMSLREVPAMPTPQGEKNNRMRGK